MLRRAAKRDCIHLMCIKQYKYNGYYKGLADLDTATIDENAINYILLKYLSILHCRLNVVRLINKLF